MRTTVVLIEVTDTQIESMLDMMAQNYDGYCFDEFYKKKVFSTWSVNKFFQSVVLKINLYTLESTGTTMVAYHQS